ncbi:LAFE_0B11452g1_1 [Lachancea fermentati]|uniref:LAFE_0B11452g1_1 n=1 Tax=Lachancea fermentati TaxID=4955 RepID=A0A1G4M8R2_LACFM|nr:LAFE_0B11452g1_1 [Lachancea fermentati]
MSELPLTSQDLSYSSSKAGIPTVVKRLFKSPRNLDFESALWEMFNLVLRPRKAYRSLYYKRQTRNRWSRDDPSFFILQIALLTLSSMVWSIVYGHSFFGFLKMMINMIVLDFFTFGFVIASVFWLVLNRPFFKFRSAQDANVEWAYCFDVHCNAYLAVWCLLYLLQFLLLPVINLHKWIGLFIGNTLYCTAFSYYFVLTFYGYSQLPILKNINFILLPSLLFAGLYIVSLFGIKLSEVFSFYNY